jgi:hypothetical protein
MNWMRTGNGRSNSIRSNKPQKQLKCKMFVNAKDVTFQVDTGASVNTLPVKYAPVSVWKVSDTTLTMWNGTIMKPLGKCRTSVTNPRNLKRYDIEFVIVSNEHTPLIGLQAAQKMGLVTIQEDNMERVLAVSTTLPSCVKKFEVVFDGGLGSFPGENRLQLKENVTPVTMPDRCTPISIRKKIKSELDRIESLGVLAKVTEPTPW